MSNQRGQTARATRLQQDADEQATLDWTRCTDCGATEDLAPRPDPPTTRGLPLCWGCLRARAERATRALFGE